MLAQIAVSAAILVATLTVRSEIFAFPFDHSRVVSPSGLFYAEFIDPGVNPDGIHEYRFSILSKKGINIAGFTFTRMTKGEWSQSDSLFVNNYVGSNLTDCLTISIPSRTSHLLSVTKAIRSSLRGVAATKRNKTLKKALDSDHLYITCSSWMGANTVMVLIRATDSNGKNYSESAKFCVLSQTINRNCH